MMIRTTFGLLVILLCYFVDSCTYGRTKEFIAQEGNALSDLNGWIFLPDVYSCRGIVSKEPCGELFTIEMDVIRDRQKATPLGNIVFPEIDTVTIKFGDSLHSYKCPSYFAYWVSNAGDDQMRRALAFIGPIKERALRIPETIGEIQMEFLVRFREGLHFFAPKSGSTVPCDTISPQDNFVESKVVVLRLIRHETAQKLPFFFQ